MDLCRLVNSHGLFDSKCFFFQEAEDSREGAPNSSLDWRHQAMQYNLEVSPALCRGLGQAASEGPFQPKLTSRFSTNLVWYHCKLHRNVHLSNP